MKVQWFAKLNFGSAMGGFLPGVSRPVCCVSPDVSHITVNNSAKHMGRGGVGVGVG